MTCKGKGMNILKTFKWSYAKYVETSCGETKYEWAASYIFDLTTYDGSLDELFVKKIIEVCKVILDGKNHEYIKDEHNYTVFILVCQILDRFNWIEWGTSIRGAWFGTSMNPRCLLMSDSVTYFVKGKRKEEGHPDIPFTKENLKTLIKFMEE